MELEMKRTERGWAGHFCMSERCMFRRNTLLEYKNGDIKVVVSTVGNVINSEGKSELIGRKWYYETMAFYTKYDGKYLDADWSKQITFTSKWYLDKLDDNLANDMHEEVVDEITQKLLNGEINGDPIEVQNME